MSDLSRLLDDVYRSGPSTPAAPAWSSDSALDEVFADWVPGESEGASAAEQAFAEEAFAEVAEPMPADVAAQLDALVQAAAAMAPGVEDEHDMTHGVEVAQVVEVAERVLEPTASLDAGPRWTSEPMPEPTAMVTPVPAITPWSRHDDDLLPRRGLGRRRRISLRRK